MDLNKIKNNRIDVQYLTFEDQQRVISMMALQMRKAPLREKIFLENGPYLAAGVIFSTSLVFWKVSHRALGLYKYGMNRLMTLSVSLIPTAFMGHILHSSFVKQKMFQSFRSECGMCYGIRSFVGHQLALLHSSATVFGICFYFAYRNETMVIPDKFYADRGSRMITKNYLLKNFRPHAKSLLLTITLSSLSMLLVGMMEYKQSLDLLKKMNLKGVTLPRK